MIIFPHLFFFRQPAGWWISLVASTAWTITEKAQSLNLWLDRQGISTSWIRNKCKRFNNPKFT